jgi:hypothetical protein
MKEDSLRGWCAKCSAKARHAAIRAVVRREGYGVTVRRLNFLRNVANRRNNRGLREIAGRDLRWTQRTFRARSPSQG